MFFISNLPFWSIIYLFTHIWCTTGYCVRNVVDSKATVNSKGRETKIIKLHTQSHTYTHNHKHGKGYNSNYSVHKYLISS